MKKIDVWLEQEEIDALTAMANARKKKGHNSSRSEMARIAIIEKIEKEGAYKKRIEENIRKSKEEN